MARARATSTEEIIDAAARLFQERGYQSTTIEDIAGEAKVSKPTVYQYAKSKQWILDQILARVMDDLGSRVRALEAAEIPREERLDEYLRLHIDSATRLRIFYAILFSEESEMSTRTRKRFRAWAHEVTEGFVDLLAEYRSNGLLAVDADLRVLANLLLTMFVSLHRWYDPDGPVSPDELRRILRDLLSGARAPAQAIG